MGDEILVCDLDESLLTVNSFPRFAAFALRRLFVEGRWRALVELAAAVVGRRAGMVGHAALKRAVIHASLELSEAHIEVWARSLLAMCLNAEVAQLVADWPGTRVLSTAAPEIYARHVGEALGFDVVDASELRGGRLRDNAGEAKVERLAERFVLPVACVVTDDAVTDAPLIRIGRRVALVERRGPRRGTVTWRT